MDILHMNCYYPPLYLSPKMLNPHYPLLTIIEECLNIYSIIQTGLNCVLMYCFFSVIYVYNRIVFNLIEIFTILNSKSVQYYFIF